jgi:hypothetical protein
MQDHDDRRAQGGRDEPRQGWRNQDDDARRAQGDGGERRTWVPPYGDERTYGRQGQRGDSRFADEHGGRYPRGGGSYGQGDYSPSAQRSAYRETYRYDDSGQAGQGRSDLGREQGAGGSGGYSGYGSSGQGQFGPGGFARGGYGGSGYGGDYGQDVRGQSARRGQEGVYGEGAGRTGEQADAYDADFDPHYLDWRRNQLAGYDSDYQHWREQQARRHDEDYRAWRDQRRRRFHEEFHGWRQERSGSGFAQSPISPATSGVGYTGQSADGGASDAGASAAPGLEERTASQAADPALRNIADGGEGRADLHEDKDEA